MVDIKENDLLDIINTLTYIQDEEGNKIPYYCFATDITVDLDCTEEELAKFSLEHNFKVYKVFSGETMLGGLVIIPEDGTINPVEKMYSDFYGEIPEISEMILKDDKLIEKNPADNIVEDIDTSNDYFEVYCSKYEGDGNPDEADWDEFNEMDNFSVCLAIDGEYIPSRAEVAEFLRHINELPEEYGVVSINQISDYDMLYDFDGQVIEYELDYDKETIELGEKKSKKKKVTVRDPNAQAMWGRTKSQTFKPKKGKGSFKRNKRICEELDIHNKELNMYPDSDLYKKELTELAHENGCEIEFYHDISKEKSYSLWYPTTDILKITKDDKYILVSNYGGAFLDMWFEGSSKLGYNNDDSDVSEMAEYLSSIGIYSDSEYDDFCYNDDNDYGIIDMDESKGTFIVSYHKNGSEDFVEYPDMGDEPIEKLNFIESVLVGFDDEYTWNLIEELELVKAPKYTYEYQLKNDFSRSVAIWDENTQSYKNSWTAMIPEICMVVNRETYKQDKLLRRKVNKNVMDGVSNFFKEHPSAKFCVISAREVSRYNKYVNTYRALMEGLRTGKRLDFHKKEEELNIQAAKQPRSPRNITFEAHSKDEFVHKNYFNHYYKYNKPKGSVEILKSSYINDVYNFVPKAKQVVDKFFKDNPKRQWCVLQAFDSDGNVFDLNKNKNSWGFEIEESLNEKIEKHDTLNPLLFDENNKLLPEVREKLLQIAKEFTDGLEQDEIKFNLKDIKIVGSNCSYNYNPNSDIDLHLVMDTKSLKCPDNLYPLLYSAYRSLFNGKLDPTIKGIPVEIFVETDDTEDLNIDNDAQQL